MNDDRPLSVPPRHRPAQVSSDVARPWQPVATPGAGTGAVTTRVQERLREKRAAQRRRTRRRWIRRGALVVFVAVAACVVAMSPLFAVHADHLEIAGDGGYVASDEVEGIVQAYVGESVVWLDVSALEDELAQVQGVRDAEVSRVWPRGLSVTVMPRVPVAAIPDGEDRVLLIDDQSVVVAVLDEAPQGLPVIEVPVGGDHVRVHEAVLAVLFEMPVELRERVESISADTQDSVTLILTEGPAVEWGSAQDSALKAQVLQVMLESQQASQADVIDVSAPTLPVTRTDS